MTKIVRMVRTINYIGPHDVVLEQISKSLPDGFISIGQVLLTVTSDPCEEVEPWVKEVYDRQVTAHQLEVRQNYDASQSGRKIE